MKSRKEITVVFTVDEEPTPGMFYDPQDFVAQAWFSVKHKLQAYKPELVTGSVKNAHPSKTR